MPSRQYRFEFGPSRNSGLFSSHWLEHRLALEPEPAETQAEAADALSGLAELWRKENARVALYGDEAGLEHAFIQPVLSILGWKLKYQTWLDRRKPDYALFLSDADHDRALASGRESANFWKSVALVADAKAWHISLDHRTGTGSQKEYPPQQIEWYLDRSRRDFGILTNGRLWRLYPREREPYQNRFETYFEFDLVAFLEENATTTEELYAAETRLDDFQRFFLFFGPAGFTETDERISLIRRAVQGSSEYRLGIGEDVRERSFEALRLCIHGFLDCDDNQLDPENDLERCRNESFVFIYRLLFAMYAEDRGLLPHGRNRLYTENRSLRRLRDEVASELDATRAQRHVDYARDSYRLWESLRELFDLIDRGHKRYDVPAYNGGLFDADEHAFLEMHRISDWHVARVIDRLGRAFDPQLRDAGLFPIDYRDLAIQHLGGIYEGMLELHPRRARVPMAVVAKRTRDKIEERIVPASAIPAGYQRVGATYQPGDVFLETNKGERRASGSYYTPDHIVKYIVDGVLGSVCADVDAVLTSEIDAAQRDFKAGEADAKARLEALSEAFDDRLLQLRVLDPAMGSGHFLLSACSYLAEEIATNPHTGGPGQPELGDGESALTYWKRQVAERCLFGVDRNEMAVELAKLAMWLETVASDRPLTFLNHRLRPGDSLVGAKADRLGGPPDDPGGLFKVFQKAVVKKLPAMLEPLGEIRGLASKETEQVKRKGRLYARAVEARAPFKTVADVWCAFFAPTVEGSLTPGNYDRLVEALDKPRAFQDITEEPWCESARAAARNLHPFHWELEFPMAYFAGKQRRSDAGFDVIIGNPPYDVLSELETGHDLSAIKAAINAEPTFKPSLRGKNNLYKLFVCRALDLLADGGHLGLITPMAILGDDQAAALRTALIEHGAFTAIESFPQKDKRERRIFRDAKLSTAVFLYQKGGDADIPFTLRVHPGRDLDEVSAELSLAASEIPLYDPANLSIVSCGQADWDLAVDLIKRGRLRRLGELAESFQGEINETTGKRGRSGRPPYVYYDENEGPEVIRGAHLCMYQLRAASQGTAVFLNVGNFLGRYTEQSPDLKAFHHQFERVGFQRKSPQNNFRRLIAAEIPPGIFLLESISYIPAHRTTLPTRLALGFLNSKLAEWWFRLGSTNAMVSGYQVENLPCPHFSPAALAVDHSSIKKALPERFTSDDIPRILAELADEFAEPPFGPPVVRTIIAATGRIIEIERGRGEISRRERSALASEAQPYQDLIDRIFYRLAGLSEGEWMDLEDRLSRML